MFTISFRVTKRQVAAAAAVFVLSLVGGVWGRAAISELVEPEADEVVEVQIPKEFDDVFTNYNAIQKTQGCNLEKYAGKRCKRYTYVVTNYPGQTDNVRANILVYKDRVIGGDVCSLELGGFMHGFVISQPETSDAAA